MVKLLKFIKEVLKIVIPNGHHNNYEFSLFFLCLKIDRKWHMYIPCLALLLLIIGQLIHNWIVHFKWKILKLLPVLVQKDLKFM